MSSDKSVVKHHRRRLRLQLEEKPAFEGRIFAYAFDRGGELIDRAPVKDGQARLDVTPEQAGRSRIFFAPSPPEEQEEPAPTLERMEKLRAYEPVWQFDSRTESQSVLRIPEHLLACWIWVLCRVRGRVVKRVQVQGQFKDSPVCRARVHVCEVDKVFYLIQQLEANDVLRLRDDLVRELEPRPLPVASLELAEAGSESAPQAVELAERPSGVASLSALPAETRAALTSQAPEIVRRALLDNVRLIIPFLCLWPYWWHFTCQEFLTLETDRQGRFDALFGYPACDKPDLYFWVEYQVGGVWETVYKPPIACWTHWNYECGDLVTIRITDPRVPACEETPDLTGRQVAVMSIGNNASVSEIDSSLGTQEGLVDSRPFGGRLEPHVWFSRKNFLAPSNPAKKIKYYRWSYRRLTDPDGITANVGPWSVMTRRVGRHFSVIDGNGDLRFPFETLGPDSTAPAPNLFRIQPIDPPSPGIDWEVRDAREDTASGFFETPLLEGGQAALGAGKYEIKLELFKANGDQVSFTQDNVLLKVGDSPAPIGQGTDQTITAPSYYHLKKSGSTDVWGFRMVLRVDNNRCEAEIKPVSLSTSAGTATVSPCGFLEYDQKSDKVKVSFRAHHPHKFANFDFDTRKGHSNDVAEASVSGPVGASSLPPADPNPFVRTGSVFSKELTVDTLLNAGSVPCPTRAAFAETLKVNATATDGWGRLSGLDSPWRSAAYALDKK